MRGLRRSEYGEEAGGRLVGLYGKAFPEAYKEDFTLGSAWSTSASIEALDGDDAVPAQPVPRAGHARRDERRFKLYRRGPLSLTAVLPLFTHFGVEVIDERPYEIDRAATASPCTSTTSGCGRASAETWVGRRDRDGLRGAVPGRRSPRCGTAAPRATASTRWSSVPS